MSLFVQDKWGKKVVVLGQKRPENLRKDCNSHHCSRWVRFCVDKAGCNITPFYIQNAPTSGWRLVKREGGSVECNGYIKSKHNFLINLVRLKDDTSDMLAAIFLCGLALAAAQNPTPCRELKQFYFISYQYIYIFFFYISKCMNYPSFVMC